MREDLAPGDGVDESLMVEFVLVGVGGGEAGNRAIEFRPAVEARAAGAAAAAAWAKASR